MFHRLSIVQAVVFVTLAYLTPLPAQTTNGVLREVFTGIEGSTIADLTTNPAFPANPSQECIESSFEAPHEHADNYGTRMRALLIPSISTNYTFYIASDDNGVLYLSTDSSPSNSKLIARVSGWSGWREWTRETAQTSAPVFLLAGKRYYLEALQKEGVGGDNLSVGWSRPGTAIEVIPGSNLEPYGLAAPKITQQPSNVTVTEGQIAPFSIKLERMLGAVFQWTRDGTTIQDVNTSTLDVGPVTLSDDGAVFQCFATNSLGYASSYIARLTVLPDTTCPTLISACFLGDFNWLSILFSEPLESVSATNPRNYQINKNVTVEDVEMSPNESAILLKTKGLSPSESYTLTVNNVLDRAAKPNSITPNSHISFSTAYSPLAIMHVTDAQEDPGPSSRRSPLSITEIMYHPIDRKDGRNLEFIEIYNSQPWPEDVGGFRIRGDIEYEFPTNTSIAARGYLVLAGSRDDFQAVYQFAPFGQFTNNLPNHSGEITLYNHLGALLSEVRYQDNGRWPASADGAGHSLVLARPSLGQLDSAAWSASDGRGGSPGYADTAAVNPYQTVLINEICARPMPEKDEFIELFNYSTNTVDLSGCILTDNPSTNKYAMPIGTVIPPLGFLVFTKSQLGFGLKSGGDTIYFLNATASKVLEAERFSGQEQGLSWGRHPDGAAEWSVLDIPTPGVMNESPFQSPVVFNEMMYESVDGSDEDEYIELYNSSTNTIPLGGWRLEGGVDYIFPSNAVLLPGGFVVAAKNRKHLLLNYSQLNNGNVFGDYDGALGNQGDEILLTRPDLVISTNAMGQIMTNTIHVLMDQVAYRSGGRWGHWSAGGGSSLELQDERADHRSAANWADSDESSKNNWVTLEYTGLVDNGSGDPSRLDVFLLGPGEALVDDIQVIPQGGQNLMVNGDFSNGTNGWLFQGNQTHSKLSPEGGIDNSPCLHLIATGRGDTGANHVRGQLKSSLGTSMSATIRAKARWLKGCPEIFFRVKGNWLDATTNILTQHHLGTPGHPNSHTHSNAGPAIYNVTHTPILPQAGKPVQVLANVNDPDGLACLLLKYRIDPSTNWVTTAMVYNGAGLYSAFIPAQQANTLAAFYVQATDNHPLGRQTTRFPANAPSQECVLMFGATNGAGNFGTYHVWMTKNTVDRWTTREKLSNDPLDCTFVYGTNRVIYNMGAQYSGSPYHSPGYDSPLGNYCDYVLTFPGDDLLLGETDVNLLLPGNGCCESTMQREQTAFWVARQMQLPFNHRRHVHVFLNNKRRAPMMMEDSQQANGDFADQWWPGKSGDLHKIQFWFEFDDQVSSFTSIGASFGNFTSGGEKKLARYRWNWARRAAQHSINDYTNLFALHDAMMTTAAADIYTSTISSVVDVEEWARIVACEHLYGNPDSFCYGGGQNLYIYKPPGERWRMILWDLDFAFSAEAANASLFTFGGDRLAKMLSHPPFRRMYYRALKDAAATCFRQGAANSLLLARYSAFVGANFTPEHPQSIISYITTKRQTILQELANVSAPFAISTAGFATNNNLVKISGTAPIDAADIAINGVTVTASWTSLTNWTITLALASGVNNLTLNGLNAQGQPITNLFSSLAITNTAIEEMPWQDVMFSEIMYNPVQSGASFVELYNRNQHTAFELHGWRIDGLDRVFDRNAIIPAGGYLVVAKNRQCFASAYGPNIPVAFEFPGELKKGETIRLLAPATLSAPEHLVDVVKYDHQSPWPTAADGEGASLQLVDPTQENLRVANWDSIPSQTNVHAATLVKMTNAWRYTSANLEATSWHAPGFNDANWPTGNALLYVETAALPASKNTLLPSVRPTWYFRTKFNYDGPTVGVVLKLTTIIDDGAVFYLNGHPLYRLRVDADPVLYNSLTSSGIGDAGLEGPFLVESDALVSGTNVLAVEVKQSTSGSSDIVFGVEVETTGQSLRSATPGAVNSVKAVLKPFPDLWLNELQSDNVSGPVDQQGRHAPWVEIFNSGTNAVNLGGLGLSDSYINLTRWSFPTNIMLPPKSFVKVWLDGQTGQSTSQDLHANFRIPKDHGSLALVSYADGIKVLDYMDYDVLGADRSWGCLPDGNPLDRRLLYFATPGSTNSSEVPSITVYINEWMADNTGSLADPADQGFEDWFELYNPNNTPVDLSGFYLSGNITNKTQFQIPGGYPIPPHGYLLIWADDETKQNTTNHSDLHVNFKLDADGEAIGLFLPNGATVDWVTFGPQETDVSEGRYPDGGASIARQSRSTPRGANIGSAANTAPSIPDLPPRIVLRGQPVEMPVNAKDLESPPQILSFSLNANVPAGAGINPVSGLFTWNNTANQPPGKYGFEIMVEDDGQPSMSTTGRFEIILVDKPQLSVPETANGRLVLKWLAISGVRYQVEYKSDLNEPFWQPLGDVLKTEKAGITITNEISVETNRFYRLLMLDSP